MYEKIKRLLHRLLPVRFVIRHELKFRFVYYQFYRGRGFECNVCGKRLRKFVPTKTGDRMCPRCGSVSRNRRLWAIVHSDFLAGRPKILEFSPSRCLYRAVKHQGSADYTGADYSGFFLADKRLDITRIDEADESYDLVICFHVLEHVENDMKAMSELYRILKRGGRSLIQTPFKEGDVDEDPEIVDPLDRMRRFGQEDHVRLYSVEGLSQRLAGNGFEVEVMEFKEENGNRYGFEEKEIVLSAIKPAGCRQE
jgi:SAM-dependent methyltransferase